MSDIALSSTQEVIERSLYEAIRKELVDKGYLPDITLLGDLDLPAAKSAYDQGIQDIITSKGFAIELYSEGSNMAKGVKSVPRIVINTGNFLPGALGGDPLRTFIDQGAVFQALVTPPQTVDFFINIHLVCETTIQERILNSLLALAIPRRGYIPFYNDPTQTFFVRYLNFFMIDDNDEGLMEKVYAYVAEDCFDTEDKIVNNNVAKINHITVTPEVDNKNIDELVIE